MASFKLDFSEFEVIRNKIENYDNEALRNINEVLHTEGGDEIHAEIMQILPSSDKRWKGKRTAAKKAYPFTQKNDVLSVTVKSRTPYNYLYFPDDGSNTLRHAGNQQFMRRGAENASSKIIDLCLKKITENF